MKLLPVETKFLIDSEEVRSLLDSELGLIDLGEAWLSLGQDYSITLGNGLGDADEFNFLCLVLSKVIDSESEAVAELYYSIDEVRKIFGDMKLIEDFVSRNPNAEPFEPKLIVDDDRLEQYELSKGFYFHEGFVGVANSFKEAIPFMLMHAMSEGGGANLSYLPDSYYEDMVLDEDDEGMENEGKVLFCDSYFSDKALGCAFHGSHYFIRE